MTLDVIVAGAGMGGLTTAIALQRQGHRVRLLERTQQLRPIGAAISIWPNGVKVLRALGLGAEIDAVAGQMDSMSYRDRDGALLTSFDLRPLYRTVDEVARPIARTALQRILLDAAGHDAVHLGVACTAFEQDASGVTVTCSNGEQWHGDLLVVADGSRSTLRDAVVGRPVPRHYRGYVNWNGRIPVASDLADEHEWAQYVGECKRVSLMPMGDGQFYFFFDVPLPLGGPNDPARYRQVLSEHFAGWPAPVQRLIERLDPSIVARVEIHDTDPLDSLIDGRVALIGDAAHAMSPDLGQGGCQAIEDAWVLAECLASHADAPADALRAYDAARRDRVASIVQRARHRAAVIHGDVATDALAVKDASSTALPPDVSTGNAVVHASVRPRPVPAETQAWYDELKSETGASIIAGLLKTAQSGPIH